MLDVIVIGGSFAGLAAALQLGRARRSVLVVDAGQRRNRFASHAHGFLGQDGVPPGDIWAKGKSEVLAYPTVRWLEAAATGARRVDGGFAVTAGGEERSARRLILATGITDVLPEIDGLAARWGQTVFHCPYCHGYELDRGRLGVLATSPLAMHQAPLVTEWSAPGGTTLFLNGAFEPDAEQQRELDAHGVRIERTRVMALGGEAPAIEVRLEGGRVDRLDGLFIAPRAQVPGPFAEQLGCALEEGPLGMFYRTDPMLKETSVPGVFACGDVARMAGALSFAVADGVQAGIAAHRSLVFPPRA